MCQPRLCSLPEDEVDDLPGQRVLDVPMIPHLAALAACAVVFRRRVLKLSSDMEPVMETIHQDSLPSVKSTNTIESMSGIPSHPSPRTKHFFPPFHSIVSV